MRTMWKEDVVNPYVLGLFERDLLQIPFLLRKEPFILTFALIIWHGMAEREKI